MPRYFHATDEPFGPGDEIAPAAEREHQGNFPDARRYDPSKVYLFDHNTTDGVASNWGRHVYEVEPLGPVEPDPERGMGGPYEYEEDDPAHGSWVTPRARVVRRLDPMTAVDDWQRQATILSEAESERVEEILERRGIKANILDPIHDTLDIRVWDNPGDPEPRLKPIHRDWIYQRLYEVLGNHGYDGMEEWLSLVLTGSLTTYQYSEQSDCDFSLFINTKVFPDWSRAEMIRLMVSEVDGTLLPGTPHVIQCFVVSSQFAKEDLYKPGLRSGYDLETDQWIVPPERSRVHDVEREENEAYTLALESADKMEKLLQYEPDSAIEYWHQIHKRRMNDQSEGKGDYAPSNVVYKMLANRGLFPKIAEVSGEYIAKTAVETLPQQLRHWQALNEEYPSRARTVHEYPDGWTIQHLPYQQDRWRTGEMMHNCWKDKLDFQPDDPAETQWHQWMSLHDENGLPQLAFHYRKGNPDTGQEPELDNILGARNRLPQPEELERLSQFGKVDPESLRINEGIYFDRG